MAPANTALPTISGTAAVGQTLTANPGTWTGDQPIVYAYRWLRCNAAGNNCVDIPGGQANDRTYTVRNADVGFTLRVRVTATNSDGSRNARSAQTARVVASSDPPGTVVLPNGEKSIPVTSVTAPERLVVDTVTFSPSPVRSRSTPIVIRVKVKDTRGYVVRDVDVFVRSTPVVTTTSAIAKTGQDGWIQYQVQPENDFVIRNGYSTQFYVKASKAGENPLGGVYGSRLVQVATQP